MSVNRQPIRPGQRYAECEECGALARGGTRVALKHLPDCSQAPRTEPAAASDEEPRPKDG